jgi:glucokinase
VTPSNKTLVFDVGGTQLRAAVFDGASGTLSAIRFVQSPSLTRHPALSWADLRERLIAVMSELRAEIDPEQAVSAAVVAFPGPVDRAHRVVAAPPLWGARGRYPYAFEADLREAWPGVSVTLLNDVSAAGYRYMRDQDDEFCLVTVSTGIGNKIFVRGKPLTGLTGQGGEIGHLEVQPWGADMPCDCGAQLEARRDPPAFAASRLSASMGLTPETLSPETLAAAYVEGDPWAKGIVLRGANALGLCFASIHMAAGIDRFVIIGGFAFGLGPRFVQALQDLANARCWDGLGNGVQVTFGESDGVCALLGGGRARHFGWLET